MAKVLRIINRFNLGGPTYNVAYLSKYMEPKYQTLLVGGMKDAEEESSEYILDSMGLTPVIIPEMKREINIPADRKALKKIRALIREYKPDIVCTHASKAGALGRIAAYNEKVPVIVHTFHGHVFHSYFGKTKTELYKQVERYLAKKSDIIVAISEQQKKELTEVYKICSPEKVKVVPLGFDLEKFRSNLEEKRAKFREQYRLDDEDVAICIVGRLAPIKNHYFFIQAIKYLKSNSNKKIKAFIVGDGEEREKLMQYCLAQGLAYGTQTAIDVDIVFTSWIKDVDFVYAGCDIAALTSLNEGTPVSLIEAQASGIPVISTDVGGVRDILDYHETLFKSDDLNGFSNMLNRMVNDDSYRKFLSEKGGHVFSKFHYTRLVSDMDEIYQEVLNQKKSLQNQ
jgi:glycosyltransferase involved in cell wall biosynthesis